MPAPFFMTHHAPLGSWSSLTFGIPGKGVAIDREALGSAVNADLLVGVHANGQTTALPFIEDPAGIAGWKIIGASELTRTLTPCVDEYVGGGISLKVYTPHGALPNPRRSGNLQYSTAPGVLIELTIDNTDSDTPATGFLGIRGHGDRGLRLRPVDWSSKALCGVGHGSRWLLAANAVKGEVFSIQTHGFARRFAEQVAAGAASINPTGNEGGVGFKVEPRAKRTVALVFAFYEGGPATQGIDTHYLYTAYFPRVEAAANYLLQNAQKIRESCASFDVRAAGACADPRKLLVFSQAVRAYEAQAQVLDAGGTPYFCVVSPEDGCRGSMDRAVDHLPWELYRNPWVIRNVFDLATTSFAYHDKVRFPGEGEDARQGGMTFGHDFGYGSAYATTGQGGGGQAEGGGGWGSAAGPGWRGGAMATENLLNGVYLLTSYALLADDSPWAKTRLPFARELLTSMECRDHWDPEKRDGILKAQSLSADREEVTTFEGVDAALAAAQGSLYLAIKTFCANLMLTTYFQNNNDLHSADYSYVFAQRTAKSLLALLPGAPRHIAALEPLAVPTYLGLTSTLPEYFPELFAALQGFAQECLAAQPQGCVDPAGGGLRLSTSGTRSIPAKVINVLYVLERMFQMDVAGQYPKLWEQVEAGVLATEGDPRTIAAALFVKPVA